MRALLIVPTFWDPVCVPLGISSLNAFAKSAGHNVELFDFNTLPEVFRLQRRYFDLGARMFPRWAGWNIERNGTEMLAMHQVLYLFARNHPRYRDFVAEVLNMAAEDEGAFIDKLDVQVLDAIFDELYDRIDAILQSLISAHRPDVVGCSLYNSTWPATLFILRRVKELCPDIRTVVGGPGPIMGITADEDEVAHFLGSHSFIDNFVVGEGEQAFLRLLEDPATPKGVLQSENYGTGRHRIETLPPPEYGNLRVERYLQLSLATSRGCPFNCSFCAETKFWHGFSQVKSPTAFNLMELLWERHRRGAFYLCDSLANQVIGPLTRSIQASGKPFKLDCYLRADPICTDLRRTKEWRAGGLFRARLGMESGSQRILDEMVKMTTPDQMSRAVVALSGAGIKTSTLWIIGYPGETEAEFAETLRFITTHRDEIYQADAWLMQYHRAGLAGSAEIENQRGSRQRFSEEVTSFLKVLPMTVADGVPVQERFNRLERFVAQMQDMELPNPYSGFQWVEADRRWAEIGRDAGWRIDDSIVAMNG